MEFLTQKSCVEKRLSSQDQSYQTVGFRDSQKRRSPDELMIRTPNQGDSTGSFADAAPQRSEWRM